MSPTTATTIVAHAHGNFAIAGKCDQTLCEAYAIGEDAWCQECKLALCREHYDSTEHRCRYMYHDARYNTNDRDALRKDLNPEAIVARARELRPGHEVAVEIPDEFVVNELAGMSNVHVPVTFDDGVEWLVRLSGYPLGPAPASMRIRTSESQAFTHEALGGIEGYPIAKIHDWGTGRFSLANNPHCIYLIYDRLPGAMCTEPGSLLEMARTDKECFRAFAKHLDKNEEGKLIVGNSVDSPWYDDAGNVVFGGPFKSLKDRYLFEMDCRLKGIRAGRMHRAGPLLPYLIFLEFHRLVSSSSELAKEESHFYLAHADMAPYNILATSDKLTAIVDWEWARTTTKAEAFSRPFWVNSMKESEMLAEAYIEAGRPDLAECLDMTNYFINIEKFVLQPRPCDWDEEDILEMLGSLSYDLDPDYCYANWPSTLREWGQRALKRYATDPYLADVVKLDRQLQDIRQPVAGVVSGEYPRRYRQWHYEDLVSPSECAML